MKWALTLAMAFLISISGFAQDNLKITASLDVRDINQETVWRSEYHYGVGNSVLEYPTKGKEYFVGFGIESNSFFLEGEYLAGRDYDTPMGYDTDYIFGSAEFKARFTTRTNRRTIQGRVGFNLSDVSLYATVRKDNLLFIMENGEWLFVKYLFAGYSPIKGLRSTYKYENLAMGAGLKYKKGLYHSLYFTGRAEYLFLSNAESNGFWNLRDLTFHQVLEKGGFYNLRAGLGYEFSFVALEGQLFMEGVRSNGHNDLWIEGKWNPPINMPISLGIKNIGTAIRVRFNLDVI